MFCFLTSLLCDIDRALLLTGNSFHTDWLDSAMWLVSDRWFWIPLYLVLTVYLVRKEGAVRGLFCLLFIAAIVAATDRTCAGLIRPYIARLRPSNPLNPLSSLLHFVNDYRGGRYGFPSCHAANTMALAIFLSLLFRKRNLTLLILSWSVLVAYSRVYLGVHYPSDLLGGFAVGGLYAAIGYAVLTAGTKFVSSRNFTVHIPTRHKQPFFRTGKIALKS